MVFITTKTYIDTMAFMTTKTYIQYNNSDTMVDIDQSGIIVICLKWYEMVIPFLCSSVFKFDLNLNNLISILLSKIIC